MKKIAEIALEIDIIIQTALLITTSLFWIIGFLTRELAIGGILMLYLGMYQLLSTICFGIWMKDIKRLYYLLCAGVTTILFLAMLKHSLFAAILPMTMAFIYYWHSWRFNESRKLSV